ncbi:L-lactate permease [Clostridium sp.]|uniref:L-lactate permease n=1 Tax=Clostridium sp. TaxID=1506 RepID=UPI0025C71EDD|nr:L-lactate permease [Clostridium sp.]
MVALTGKGIKVVKGVFGITLAFALGFAIPHIFVEKFIGAELPAVVGSMTS